MQNTLSIYLKRFLALTLAMVMVMTMIPFDVFANGDPANPGPKTSDRAVDAEGKPPVDWDKSAGEGRDDGSAYWSLPAGVKIVNAHNSSDPINTFGFTYLGRYLDDQGRIVL